MKMFFTKCWGHKAPKGGAAANPFNDLTLTQLYEVWSSSVAQGEDYKTDEVFERIKRFVEEEHLAKHPVHLVRALIRFTSTCNDYAFGCVKDRN